MNAPMNATSPDTRGSTGGNAARGVLRGLQAWWATLAGRERRLVLSLIHISEPTRPY